MKLKKPKAKWPWWHKYIYARARQVFKWSPERRQAIKDATRGGKVFCALCEEEIREKLQVDHKVPVVSVTEGFVGFDEYFSRLYVTNKDLQVVCKPCHATKTKLENAKRRKKSEQQSS